MLKTNTLLLMAVLSFQWTFLEGRQPYHATVTVGPDEASVSDPNLVDLRRSLDTASLELLIPFYTPVSPVSIDIDLRGIDVYTFFPAGSTTLYVEIPDTGVSTSFTGATRDDSITLLKDYIHDAGTQHNLLRAYAKHSPIDPIAGNPNSLMGYMSQADYLMGHLSPLSGCDCSFSAQPVIHEFQLGTKVCRAFSKGFDTTTVTLPVRYSYSPDLNWALIIDAPLTYIRNGGASSFFSSFGFGFRFPITYSWSITPLIRLGAGGSLDLCTVGDFFSAGLTSVYNYKLFEYVLSLTNYAGYYTSTNLWLSGINFNYRLQNYVFKNGLSITSCEGLMVCGRQVNFSLSFIDSYFTRNRLFLKHYDEVEFSLFTTGVNPCIDYDCLSVGFSYQFGEKDYRGYALNMVYQF